MLRSRNPTTGSSRIQDKKQKDRIKGNQEDEGKRNLDEVRVLKRSHGDKKNPTVKLDAQAVWRDELAQGEFPLPFLLFCLTCVPLLSSGAELYQWSSNKHLKAN
ncbi:RNA recognition motif-containing protein [Corchorus olitorius]|uniref:RNA recognition motif-containing protein n=1 Tax=Corchorus olitorius TaxID=93759 RepID=A0A1R3HW14_9ROSI|nr:RNA recognition motif-containing protein [Corchorus olitorius]